jgi:hypothetical protein
LNALLDARESNSDVFPSLSSVTQRVENNLGTISNGLLMMPKAEIVLKKFTLKAYKLSEFNFFLILKVANIRCFILIAVKN